MATLSRPRAGSFKETIQNIENDPSHHLTGSFLPNTPPGTIKKLDGNRRKRSGKSVATPGLWNDLRSMAWMTEPASSLKMLLVPIVLCINWHFVASKFPNPFSPLLFISYPVPNSSPGDPRYAKGYNDILFVAYYVVVFSFIRQTLTIHFLKPIARKLGITNEGKLDRFGEQGYALIYFTFFGVFGLIVMSQLPTWWYESKHYWIEYPYWAMQPLLKRYYLMQLAYWIQQLIVLVLGLEKPRKDFAELVVHHFVTIWLVGWSYLTSMTPVGNAVFVTMDVSDVFLAASKLFNYLQLERTAAVAFSIFVAVWTYFRHYLNLKILYSVWTQFELIPEYGRQWKPEEGVWMAPWMQYQIFVPILLLQAVNLFWYFLIWRVLLRALFKSNLADERSDDEDDGEDVTTDKQE